MIQAWNVRHDWLDLLFWIGSVVGVLIVGPLLYWYLNKESKKLEKAKKEDAEENIKDDKAI